MPPTIDLRSDTVTKPTPAMYEAMRRAELGDDMAGEDPTVNRLEARAAEMLGKEAALLCCTATQSNQLAVWSHCAPGDELLIHETGHIANFEAGAPAALSGVSCRTVAGPRGFVTVETLEEAWRPQVQHFPWTRLLCLENTTNLGGGAAWPIADLHEVCQWARQRELRIHLDGARLFNAAIARDEAIEQITAPVDTVTICFSKGLGCPFGSILAGPAETIARARRGRRVLGGALRQAGVIAGAADYALAHHIDRLADDHHNARRLAEAVAPLEPIRINLAEVESNIIFFEIAAEWGTAAEFVAALAEEGIGVRALGRQRIRAVTHIDVSDEEISRASEAIATVITARTAGKIPEKPVSASNRG